jgi:hypothetical protein
VPLALVQNSLLTWHQVAAADLQDAALAAPAGDRTGGVLSPGKLERARSERLSMDIVEEWGMQSFPASDPPANW